MLELSQIMVLIPLGPPLTRGKRVEIEAINWKKGCVGYLSQLTAISRKNRNNPTDAERRIWNEVLKRRQTGFCFLRQKPLFRFIADFYCSELNLVIEIDGNAHDKRKGYDEARDKFLKQIGIATIRFTNEEVMNHLNGVKSMLKVSLVKGRNGCAERD